MELIATLRRTLTLSLFLAPLLPACVGSLPDDGSELPDTEDVQTQDEAVTVMQAELLRNEKREQRRKKLMRTSLPKAGCFTAGPDDEDWKEVPCVEAPRDPLLPAAAMTRKPSPLVVGGGAGTGQMAQPSSGSITWSEGRFPNVAGVTTVTDSMTGTANDFSLQVNSNTFTTTLCNSAATPASCSGWQQFVYSRGSVFMQYWMINFAKACPVGWMPFMNHCFRNSPAVAVPTRPTAADLGRLVIAGAAGTTDNVSFYTSDGSLFATSAASIFTLQNRWASSEFNIFGASNGSQANFNANATMVVETLTSSGTANAARCLGGSTTGETNSLNGVAGTCCAFGGATPGIRFTQSNNATPPVFACPPAATPAAKGEVAASRQFGLDQTDLFTIDTAGEITVSWVFKGEPWSLPVTSTGGVFPAGAPLVATEQFGTPSPQTDVLAVDNNGTLRVSAVVGGGAWAAPITIGAAGQYVKGTHVAASQQVGTSAPQTDVFAVNKFGALTASWVVRAGTWSNAEISARNLFPAGAPVAVSRHIGASQTDVFVVDNSGRLNVMWVVNGGAWQGPAALSAAGKFKTGAFIAASQQFGVTQTDVFIVDVNGNLTATWVVGTGAWQGPVNLSSGSLFASGAPVAASQQFGTSSSQTDVFAINKSGALMAAWVVGGGAWNGPLALSANNQFASASPVAASQQFGVSAQTDVFAINSANLRSIAWVQGGGAWAGPLPIP